MRGPIPGIPSLALRASGILVLYDDIFRRVQLQNARCGFVGASGHPGSTRKKRRGFTLIELLVVVFIVLAISALSVAMVVPSIEERRVREASLSVTSFLNGVRAEAIRTGRPVGVWIERAEGVNGDQYATRMYRCTIPPAYTGVTLTTTIVAGTLDAADVPSGYTTRTLNIVTNSDGSWLAPDEFDNKNPASPVGPGDTIKLGYQGHTYQLEFDHTDDVWFIGQALDDAWFMNSDTATQPYVTPPTGIPYQVFRQPRLGTFARSATPPMVLPPSVVIDLNFSGDDNRPLHLKEADSHVDPYIGESLADYLGYPNGDRYPIVLMFSSTGAVERIYRTTPSEDGTQLQLDQGQRPTGPIYLLLGKIDKAQADLTVDTLENLSLENAGGNVSEERRLRAEQVERYNLFDLNNLWITIHPRTGQITSSPMAAPEELFNGLPAAEPLQWRVNEARAFARSMRGQGGI